MNGIAFRSFRSRNSCQKNTSTVYSGIGINGIVPKRTCLLVASQCFSAFSTRTWLSLFRYDAPRFVQNHHDVHITVPCWQTLVNTSRIFDATYSWLRPPLAEIQYFTESGVYQFFAPFLLAGGNLYAVGRVTSQSGQGVLTLSVSAFKHAHFGHDCINGNVRGNVCTINALYSTLKDIAEQLTTLPRTCVPCPKTDLMGFIACKFIQC